MSLYYVHQRYVIQLPKDLQGQSLIKQILFYLEPFSVINKSYIILQIPNVWIHLHSVNCFWFHIYRPGKNKMLWKEEM